MSTQLGREANVVYHSKKNLRKICKTKLTISFCISKITEIYRNISLVLNGLYAANKRTCL